MLTWTTYGRWLQGDGRGYSRDGRVLGRDPGVRRANRDALKGDAVCLSTEERQIVEEAINSEARSLGQKIYAAAVCPRHVHLVLECNSETMETTAARYKRAATAALTSSGFEGKIWTRGYDKRFCFDEKTLRNRIEYVLRHNGEGGAGLRC